MIAKIIKTQRNGLTARRTFENRVNYCCAKADVIAVVNLAGDWRDAAAQMTLTAGLNPGLRDPSAHIVLSWPDGECPDDQDVIGAARMAMQELGGGWHQQIIAIHRDRFNLHAHIVLNRVLPASGRALSMSHDYARLELGCRRIERQFGWPPDRGRFDQMIVDGKVRLVPKTPEHWDGKRAEREAGVRPDPRSVRGMSLRSGQRPLRDRMSTELRRAARVAMQAAGSWLELHSGLLPLGLRYLIHRSGARIEEVATGERMPANHMGSAFGLPRLMARFGTFIAAPMISDREAMTSAARRRYDEDRRSRRQDLSDLLDRHRVAHNRLVAALRGLPRDIRGAFTLALRQAQREELRSMRESVSIPNLHEYGLGETIERHNEAQKWAMRYRHGLRRTGARQDGFALAQPPIDHTRLRQIWHQCYRDPSGAFRLPGPGDDAADLRSLGDGLAMMPRRGPRGDLHGFELLHEEAQSGRVTVEAASQYGLAFLGDRQADDCIVVADAALGMRLSAARPDDLVIVTCRQPTSRQIAQVAGVIGLRRSRVVVESSRSQSDFIGKILATLPEMQVVDLSTTAAADQTKMSTEADADPPSWSPSS